MTWWPKGLKLLTMAVPKNAHGGAEISVFLTLIRNKVMRIQ